MFQRSTNCLRDPLYVSEIQKMFRDPRYFFAIKYIFPRSKIHVCPPGQRNVTRIHGIHPRSKTCLGRSKLFFRNQMYGTCIQEIFPGSQLGIQDQRHVSVIQYIFQPSKKCFQDPKYGSGTQNMSRFNICIQNMSKICSAIPDPKDVSCI